MQRKYKQIKWLLTVGNVFKYQFFLGKEGSLKKHPYKQKVGGPVLYLQLGFIALCLFLHQFVFTWHHYSYLLIQICFTLILILMCFIQNYSIAYVEIGFMTT
eukprot:UN05952